MHWETNMMIYGLRHPLSSVYSHFILPLLAKTWHYSESKNFWQCRCNCGITGTDTRPCIQWISTFVSNSLWAMAIYGPFKFIDWKTHFFYFQPRGKQCSFLKLPFLSDFILLWNIYYKYLFCFICFFTTFGIRFTFERNVDGVVQH